MSDNQSSGFMHPEAQHAVRMLAGRLSHDFNNLLTPLLAYPQLVRRDLSPDASSQALLDVMESTADDIARICQQLARLAPDQGAPAEYLEVKPLAEDAIRLHQDDARTRKVDLSLAVEEGLPGVLIGESQLTGILDALLKNAIEAAAAQGGGTVALSAGRHTVTAARQMCGRQIPPGSYIRFDVSDDGSGIPDEAQALIFEPMFTTGRKRRVRGSGLDLTFVYACLADANGYIDFETGEGQGTTFSVFLPEHDRGQAEASPAPAEPVAAADPDPGAPELPIDGAARILVCDDEQVIVKLFRLMIRSGLKGVEVDDARNGADALDLFRERRHHVVVMDLHMPVMDGQTAFHKIEEYCNAEGCPMPTVIFCTGYAPPDGVRRLAETGGRHALLLKPVNTQVLIDAVRSGLKGSHGHRR